MRVGEVAERAGVAVAGEEPGEALDQVAEGDRAEPGAGADQQRQRRQQAALAAQQGGEPGPPGRVPAESGRSLSGFGPSARP